MLREIEGLIRTSLNLPPDAPLGTQDEALMSRVPEPLLEALEVGLRLHTGAPCMHWCRKLCAATPLPFSACIHVRHIPSDITPLPLSMVR